MNCINCNKNQTECSKKSINQNPICKKCKLCFICKQQDNIALKNINCIECCDVCKSCKKIVVKNNWPNNAIIDGLCNKCFNLCSLCKKYTSDNKCIYKLKIRYCEKCFVSKFDPSNSNTTFLIVTNKKANNSLIKNFVEWKKDKIKFKCESCERYTWKLEKNKSILCSKCKGIKRISKNTTHKIDPSSDKAKYLLTEEKKNDSTISYSWMIDTKKEFCSNCCMSIWIKKDNLHEGLYSCSRCKPTKINYKYKYNKNKQIWEYYSKKLSCVKCLKQRWVHINDSNFGQKSCKSCIKLKIEL